MKSRRLQHPYSYIHDSTCIVYDNKLNQHDFNIHTHTFMIQVLLCLIKNNYSINRHNDSINRHNYNINRHNNYNIVYSIFQRALYLLNLTNCHYSIHDQRVILFRCLTGLVNWTCYFLIKTHFHTCLIFLFTIIVH